MMVAQDSVKRLVTAWVDGWAISRGVPRASRVPGGFWLRVGLPEQRERYVLQDWDAAAIRAVDEQALAGTWLKLPGSHEDLRKALPARWTVHAPTYLMSTRFTAGPRTVPPPYRLDVTVNVAVTAARALDPAGNVAVAAYLAAAGEAGIVDRVGTEPEHQRRGLGSAVMGALADHAIAQGITRGVLVATEEGHELYRALGWTTRAEIAAACVPAMSTR